jgi:hypothetical protein
MATHSAVMTEADTCVELSRQGSWKMAGRPPTHAIGEQGGVTNARFIKVFALYAWSAAATLIAVSGK